MRAVGVFLLWPVLTFSLDCFVGWQIWEAEPPVNNATLLTCEHGSKCCSMVSSLPGTSFGCEMSCPAKLGCGPDTEQGFQDIRYCFCADEKDEKCRPFLGENSQS